MVDSSNSKNIQNAFGFHGIDEDAIQPGEHWPVEKKQIIRQLDRLDWFLCLIFLCIYLETKC